MAASSDAQLRSKIEISILCDNVQNKDVYTKSDPFVQVFTRKSSKSPWGLIARTETVMNNLSPRFSKHIAMDFIFEQMQELKLVVLDYDQSSRHDFLGMAQTNVAHIMATAGNSVILTLMDQSGKRPAKSSAKRIKGKQKPATISLHATQLSQNNDEIRLRFAGHKLANKDGLFGKSDPFYIISKRREGTTNWIPCFTSEVIDNDLNPKWCPRQLKQQTLGMESDDSMVKIDVYDWDDHTSHDIIGCFTATVRELKSKVTNGVKLKKSEQATRYLPLRHPPTKAKYKKKSYKHSGLLEVVDFERIECASMLQYIQGGMEINLTICVDYTGSNGRVTSPTSLHYLNPHATNQYQTAMLEVGAILQEYDTDKMLTLYGFGAKVDGALSHCFPVTLDHSQPDVYSIDGAHQAYVQSIQSGRVALFGPTYFAPMLREMRAKATNCMSQAHQKYHVMMILTDGAIMDMKQTVDEIVLLSKLPVSIIIIGVGPADFSSMEKLDGDKHPLRHSRPSIGVCKRDCVQFVPFNAHKGSPAALAAATLQELPGQVELYMRMNGIKPNPPRAVAPGSMTVEALPVAEAVHGAAGAYAAGATAVAVNSSGAFPAPYQQPAAATGAVAQPYGHPASGAVAQPYGHPASTTVAQPYQQPGHAPTASAAALTQPYSHPASGAVAQPYGHPASGAGSQQYGHPAAAAVAQPYGHPPAGAVAQPYSHPAAGAVTQPPRGLPPPQSALNVQVPAGVVAGQAIRIQTPDGQTLEVNVPAGMGAGATFQVKYQPRNQTTQSTGRQVFNNALR